VIEDMRDLDDTLKETSRMKDYVEQREGGYYLADSRIGLDSIVARFKEGASAESIFRSFPAAGSLEKIYGAITFYLSNKEAVDAYLCRQETLVREMPVQQGSEALVEKLKRAKHEAVSPR
jgi:uncharacterized protein (DUF433 family)